MSISQMLSPASGISCVLVLEVSGGRGQRGTWNVHPEIERHEIIVGRLQRQLLGLTVLFWLLGWAPQWEKILSWQLFWVEVPRAPGRRDSGVDLMLCFHSQLLAVHLERCCLGLRGPCAVHHCGKSPPLGVEGLGFVGPATLSSCPPQPVAAHTPPHV